MAEPQFKRFISEYVYLRKLLPDDTGERLEALETVIDEAKGLIEAAKIELEQIRKRIVQ